MQDRDRNNRRERRNTVRFEMDINNVAPPNQEGILPAVDPINQAPPNQNVAAPDPQNQNVANNPPVINPPPAPIEVWKTAPDRGNFNPGTKHGQIIFNEKLKGLPEDKRLDLNRTNGPDIHKVLRAREPHFRGITAIPIKIDALGSVVEFGNILSQHQKITLLDCQRAGHIMFQDGFTNRNTV